MYDLLELGVENFRSLQSFKYDTKISPKMGSKPLIAFVGEGFESSDELKHLKEILLDLLRGEVCYSVSYLKFFYLSSLFNKVSYLFIYVIFNCLR